MGPAGILIHGTMVRGIEKKMKLSRRYWNVFGWAILILTDLMNFLIDILSAQTGIERFPFEWNHTLKLAKPFLLFIVKKISI